MNITYVGTATRRVIADEVSGKLLVWEPANGYTVEVSNPGLAANLLTYPRPDFISGPDEPLTRLPGVGEERVALLALAGVATFRAMADLDESGVQRLARNVSEWASEDQVREWVKLARAILFGETEE